MGNCIRCGGLGYLLHYAPKDEMLEVDCEDCGGFGCDECGYDGTQLVDGPISIECPDCKVSGEEHDCDGKDDI